MANQNNKQSPGSGGNKTTNDPVWRQGETQRANDAAKAIKSGPKK